MKIHTMINVEFSRILWLVFFVLQYSLIVILGLDQYTWTSKKNLKGNVAGTLLFESTAHSIIMCAHICFMKEHCIYFVHNKMSDICKGFDNRGSHQVTPVASSEELVWERKCSDGYEYLEDPRLCIRVYNHPIVTRDEAQLYCISNNSRLVVLNSKEKKLFAWHHYQTMYPGGWGFYIGVKYNNSQGIWIWESGEHLDTSLPWAWLYRNTEQRECCVIWNGGYFDDFPCNVVDQDVAFAFMCEEL